MILDLVNQYVIPTEYTKNKQLEPLLKEFTNNYLQSREPSTIKKYECYFRSWEIWSSSVYIKTLPAEPVSIALYILHLIQYDQSFPVIESSFYAINFYHSMFNLDNPCKSPVVKNMLEAAKRIKHHKIRKKKAISVEQIRQIYNHCLKNDSDNINVYNMRTLTLVIVSFCGFLRYSEAANIKRSDIVFRDSYMKIFIEKSKTDIYRNGCWVFIARGESELCPLTILQKYLNLVKINKDSDEYVFRSITSHRDPRKRTLRHKNVPLSYTRAREIFLEVISKVKLDKAEFSLHSLRAGGASAAANAGVKDRLFKRHGRWRSDKAKDGYIDDDLNALLSVSKMLGV